jgi:hypothetical protein
MVANCRGGMGEVCWMLWVVLDDSEDENIEGAS